MAYIFHNSSYDLKKFPADIQSCFDYYSSVNQNVIIILPTGKLVRETENKLTRYFFGKSGKPIHKTEIYTLQKFIYLCYRKLFPSERAFYISDDYRLALFEEAAANVNLKFFRSGNKKLTDSVIKRLCDIIYGLKEDGITPESLFSDLESSNINIENPNKLSDIASIYAEYQRLLGANLLDATEIINRVVSKVRESLDLPFDLLTPGNPVNRSNVLNSAFDASNPILCAGFSEFKLPEVEFIGLFATSTIPFAINVDYSLRNGPLFGNLSDTMKSLSIQGFRSELLNEDIKESEEAINTDSTFEMLKRTDYIRRWIFNTDKQIKNPQFSELFKIYAANDRIDEVRSIAKLVKWLCLRKNYSPAEICIVSRQPAHYSSIFRDIFSLYNIPVNVSDRFNLSSSGVVLAIIGIFDILINKFRLNDIRKVLLNRYLDLKILNRDNFNSENLISTALKLNIRGGSRLGGAKGWKDRFDFKIRLLNAYLQSNLNEYDDYYDKALVESEISKVNSALHDFIAFENALPKVESYVYPSDFKKLIESIIESFCIENQILNSLDQSNHAVNINSFYDEIEKDFKALTSFKSMIDEMCHILNVRTPDKKYAFKDLVSKLKIAISEAKYQILEKAAYGVRITAIEQSRGIDCKVMILCGAVDTEFPLAYQPDNFLGKSLPGSEERQIEAERLQFYHFLTNSPVKFDSANKRVYIFYPKNDETRELIRSPFIDELLKITTLAEDSCIIDLTSGNNFHNVNSNEHLEWQNSITTESDLLSRMITRYSIEFYQPTDKYYQKIYRIMKIRESLATKGKADLSRIGKNGNPIELRPINAAISISELETYAKCPYKYFISRILHIQEPFEPESGLTNAEKGSILHKILYRFFSIIQQEESPNNPEFSINPVQLNEKFLEHYKDILNKLFDQEYQDLQYANPILEMDSVKKITGVNDYSHLMIWLQSELRRLREGWYYKPAFFEFGFGLGKGSSKLNLKDPVDLGDGLILRGKIDRVEILQSGNELKFLIADYKLSESSIPKDTDISNGISFQLPLYALAMSKVFQNEFKIKAYFVAGVYYPLKLKFDLIKNRYSSEEIFLAKESVSQNHSNKSKNKTDEIIDNSRKMALEIIDGIRSGLFPVEPQKGQCKYCQYGSICRIKETVVIND